MVRLRERRRSFRGHGPRFRVRFASLREHTAGLRGRQVSRGGLGVQRHGARVQRLLSRHDGDVRVTGHACPRTSSGRIRMSAWIPRMSDGLSAPAVTRARRPVTVRVPPSRRHGGGTVPGGPGRSPADRGRTGVGTGLGNGTQWGRRGDRGRTAAGTRAGTGLGTGNGTQWGPSWGRSGDRPHPVPRARAGPRSVSVNAVNW